MFKDKIITPVKNNINKYGMVGTILGLMLILAFTLLVVLVIWALFMINIFISIGIVSFIALFYWAIYYDIKNGHL